MAAEAEIVRGEPPASAEVEGAQEFIEEVTGVNSSN